MATFFYVWLFLFGKSCIIYSGRTMNFYLNCWGNNKNKSIEIASQKIMSLVCGYIFLTFTTLHACIFKRFYCNHILYCSSASWIWCYELDHNHTFTRKPSFGILKLKETIGNLHYAKNYKQNCKGVTGVGDENH